MKEVYGGSDMLLSIVVSLPRTLIDSSLSGCCLCIRREALGAGVREWARVLCRGARANGGKLLVCWEDNTTAGLPLEEEERNVYS
jgi:hypothetical protein